MNVVGSLMNDFWSSFVKKAGVYLKYINDITCVLRGIMKSQHVDPEEAVQIHMDIQAKTSLAIHWGTFALAYEVWACLSLPHVHSLSVNDLHWAGRLSLLWLCVIVVQLWLGSPVFVVVLRQASLLRLRIHASLRESLAWRSRHLDIFEQVFQIRVTIVSWFS